MNTYADGPDLLTALYSTGEFKIKKHLAYKVYDVPFKTLMIKDTDIHLDVYLEMKIRQLTKNNHAWYRLVNVPYGIHKVGFYRKRVDIPLDKLLNELKEYKKDKLLKLILFNLDIIN